MRLRCGSRSRRPAALQAGRSVEGPATRAAARKSSCGVVLRGRLAGNFPADYQLAGRPRRAQGHLHLVAKSSDGRRRP
ncbi:hypothetical protein C884_01855 [Kocuria palustris PEL]|uniref:Uncharacterized protein n=1 Tax=Kocuria palustris PEL TaxID=1236550 RepID=M2WFP0_9MICC|nr:hypothetical protein C884_01855 [Kocuria palustris PEL]